MPSLRMGGNMADIKVDAAAAVGGAVPARMRQIVPDDLEDDEEDMMESVEPSPSSEFEEEVCVDATHLAAYPAHVLVHPTHIDAAVLCPLPVSTPASASASLPCATADHLLRIDGVSLSYRDFCGRDDVRCESRRMPVNSVFAHLWEETSHSNAIPDAHVKLTMLDSRHPEVAQKLLHRATALKRAISRKLFI